MEDFGEGSGLHQGVEWISKGRGAGGLADVNVMPLLPDAADDAVQASSRGTIVHAQVLGKLKYVGSCGDGQRCTASRTSILLETFFVFPFPFPLTFSFID